MFMQFVKVNFQNQWKKIFFARQTSLNNILLQSNRKASSKEKMVNDESSNDPIKYSNSEASTWLAARTRNPGTERHPYEVHIILISLMSFMLYFFILREENDIDLSLSKSLPEIVSNINKINAASTSFKKL